MARVHIGNDEWVEQYHDRLLNTGWIRQKINHLSVLLPRSAWITIALVIVVITPIASGQPYILRVMGSMALMVMLGAGLNIITGYAGLLDLGYLAFYGLGAYGYAYLSSDFTGIHLPLVISLPLIILFCSAIGALLGTVSLRLSGDYLAIATLGFGLIFEQMMSKLDRVSVPWQEEPLNVTGGSNGIVRLDGLNIGWMEIDDLSISYTVMVIAVVLVLIIVHRLNQSPVGRGWRALEQDELAASTMGIPTQPLKVLALSIGAGIAGMAGAFFALWQGAVFPSSFELSSLIILYGVVVLGGLGSLRGVVFGAVFMVALPEILRNPSLANSLFYITTTSICLTILKVRWSATLPLLLFVGSIWFSRMLSDSDITLFWGNVAFGGLVVLLLLLIRSTSYTRRLFLLCLTLPTAAIAWHWRLLPEPGITRFILLGALLIALMIYRPQGLFGQQRVEVL